LDRGVRRAPPVPVRCDEAWASVDLANNLRRERQLEGIAKALKIGRASVYRVLEAG
jgi:hypothetical protein